MDRDNNKEEKVKKRVCLFCRESYKAFSNMEDFIKDQAEILRLINNTPGWEYTSIYAEVEGSENGFGKMVTDCLKGKIDIILTWSIDQFAGSFSDTVKTALDLAELEPPVEIRFVKENLSSLDESVIEIFRKILETTLRETGFSRTKMDRENSYFEYREELMKTDRF